MWSYYGSKSRVVHLYPAPQHGKIIEPFAGSARYSLMHFEKEVTLCDKYKVITDIWKWLQQCNEKDILGLPDLKEGQDLRTMNLSDPERMFLGMMAGISSVSPRNKISPFSAQQNSRKNQYRRIANNLHKIRHWNIIEGSYEDLPNEKATWFIDAPYQVGGQAYVHNTSSIDFDKLREWCQERLGQIIVCENTGATWMDFCPLSRMRGGNREHTVEAMWTNSDIIYRNRQAMLFY